MKRLFDFTFALFLLVIFAPLFLIVALVIVIFDPGSPLYWSQRVGKDNQLFSMPKFRSMKLNTPQVATHLLTNSNDYLIKGGNFIRKSSLDELPQLLSILKGDMSFVGPRPALFNQDDLIGLRTEKGVHTIKPGLTGWAQINGRDEIPIPQKVDLDAHYLNNQSFFLDLKIIALTGLKVILRKDISH